MSPALHTTKDGSQYVLYGQGGETVKGILVHTCSYLLFTVHILRAHPETVKDLNLFAMFFLYIKFVAC